MPPKAKPKGLKASKRAAPFDPSSAAASSTETPLGSTSSDVKLNPEQTMPLDEDCLTISDLFELRQSVIDICYPFPHSLTLDPDPEKVDEARSLLRGILHGCAVLEPFVVQSSGSDKTRSRAEVETRRKDAGEEKLEALGLGVRENLAEGYLLALQSFALLHLGELFEEPEVSASSVAARAAGGGGKRRKIDVNEPKSRLEWLAAAYERGNYLWTELCQGAYGEGDDDAMVAYFNAEFGAVATVYTKALIDDGEVDQAEGTMPATIYDDGQDQVAEYGMGLMGAYGSVPVDESDRLVAQLRRYTTWINYVETWPSALSGDMQDVEPAARELNSVASVFGELAAQLKGEAQADHWSPDSIDAEQVPLLAYLCDVVAADAKAAKFVVLEERVEAEYRPDDEDNSDDDEQEVKPLPMNKKDVKDAKKAGEEAIKAVRATIEAHAALPKAHSHPEGKTAQYRKLEELLLVSSALINPDDKAATAEIEKEIAHVRKDGGLEEEEEEEEEGKGGSKEKQAEGK
ncbi:hypothetical protein JCM11641_007740 [Rhodosporidiobolus odoratus]